MVRLSRLVDARLAHRSPEALIRVSKSVPQTTKANLICPSVPGLIEVTSVTLFHILIHLMLFPIVAKTLFYDFAALTIHHSFVSHLLVTRSLVFKHLLPFGYLFAVGSRRTLGLRLVDLAHRFSVGTDLRSIAVGLHLELSVTSFAHATSEITDVHHARAHLLHHLVDASHAHHRASLSIEKRVILEGVIHEHAHAHAGPKALKHLISHLAHVPTLLLRS